MFDFEFQPEPVRSAPAHLPFYPDLDIRRLDCVQRDGTHVLVFDLVLDEEMVPAFEYVTREGTLVAPEMSGIKGPHGMQLCPEDLLFVRTLLDRRFFYDLQAIEADYYMAHIYPD